VSCAVGALRWFPPHGVSALAQLRTPGRYTQLPWAVLQRQDTTKAGHSESFQVSGLRRSHTSASGSGQVMQPLVWSRQGRGWAWLLRGWCCTPCPNERLGLSPGHCSDSPGQQRSDLQIQPESQ